MLRFAYAGAACVAAAALFAPSSAHTQDAPVTYPQFEVHGRLHTQAYFFDNEEYADVVGTSSSFLLRRARFNVEAQVSDRVSFVLIPSFENSKGRGDFRLRDAYVDLLLSNPEAAGHVSLRVGQEKRPFSRLELTSSNSLIGIERGAGPGLISSQANDLFGSAGYLSHDIGASLAVESGVFALRAGVYNGTGETAKETNDAKSFGARATVQIEPRLSVGGSLFSHDGIVGADSSFRNTGFGVDAQWGRPGAAGLYALAEVLQGEAFAAGDRTMRGFSGLIAYQVRRQGERLAVMAIEPMARIDLADPDTDADDDGATLVSGGIGLYFTSRAQLRIAVEHQSFQAPGASSITGVRSAVIVNF